MVSRGFGVAPDTEPPERPDGEQYAEEWNPSTDKDEDKGEDEDDSVETSPSNHPPVFREERHPTVLVSWGDHRSEEHGTVVVQQPTVARCGCGYQLGGEVEKFPPVERVRVSVYGTRYGDTVTAATAEVVSADPFVVSVPDEHGTLYRWWATGCLVCGGDGA